MTWLNESVVISAVAHVLVLAVSGIGWEIHKAPYQAGWLDNIMRPARILTSRSVRTITYYYDENKDQYPR